MFYLGLFYIFLYFKLDIFKVVLIMVKSNITQEYKVKALFLSWLIKSHVAGIKTCESLQMFSLHLSVLFIPQIELFSTYSSESYCFHFNSLSLKLPSNVYGSYFFQTCRAVYLYMRAI